MFAGAKRILDVGCGVGEAAQWVDGADYFGIDLSEILVREDGNKRNRYLTVASVTILPFSDKIFDRVTCMGVLHHLTRDQITPALQEMIRVLKIGGSIAIIEPNPWSVYQRLFAYIRPAERGILNTSPHNLRHIIQSVGGVEIEKFEYDHTMFWPSYMTFVLRRWVWPTGPLMTGLFLLLHRIVKNLTPGPLCSHTFWKLKKIA
jgi:SAM-dependent methyltransferase